MQLEIVISGFGGQGALFAGQLLAYAGMDNDKHVTWIPSYGPEMRGGTANCTVVVSDDPIGSPLVRNPAAVIALNLPSVDKYEGLVKPGGLLVVNQSLMVTPPARTDLEVVLIPATEAATEMGQVRVANMILFGALLARQPLVRVEAVLAVLQDKLGARKAHLLAINRAALERGAALAQAQPVE